MPFPNKEIEDAYQDSLPIAQGCFREDPELMELGGLLQRHYEEVQKRVDEETMQYVNGLRDLLLEAQEYQCRHGFTEGWLTALGKRKNV